jgi:hypothetical protein
MRPLVLSEAIELSLITLWQVRTCSIAICLSLPSHSWFPSYRASLVFFFFCVCVCRTSYTFQIISCTMELLSFNYKYFNRPRLLWHSTDTQQQGQRGISHTYQRPLLLALSVHGGQRPCLPSQMWAGVLAPLLSRVVRVRRLGNHRSGVPPHHDHAIIRIHLSIPVSLTLTSQWVQYRVTFNNMKHLSWFCWALVTPALINTHAF